MYKKNYKILDVLIGGSPSADHQSNRFFPGCFTFPRIQHPSVEIRPGGESWEPTGEFTWLTEQTLWWEMRDADWWWNDWLRSSRLEFTDWINFIQGVTTWRVDSTGGGRTLWLVQKCRNEWLTQALPNGALWLTVELPTGPLRPCDWCINDWAMHTPYVKSIRIDVTAGAVYLYIYIYI